VRTPFGTDRLEPGADGSLTLSCAASKGWRPRASAVSRRADHPGTAVSWQDEIFEVVSAEPLADGGVRYSLAPWRDDFAIRSLERYDTASEAGRDAERRWRSDSRRRRRLAIVFSPLLGHLPGPVQESMQAEFGAPANAMTAASALPLFAVGAVGLFGQVARIGGGSPAPLPEISFPLSLYLVGESALRLVVVATQSRPAGSLPGAIAYALWRKLAPG
jgi:hypothetical protein